MKPVLSVFEDELVHGMFEGNDDSVLGDSCVQMHLLPEAAIAFL